MQLNGSPLNGAALNGSPRRALRSAVVVALADSSRWRLRVLLGGADLSARLVGLVSIDREEGAARVLKLMLVPEPGLLSLDDYTGKPIQLLRQRLEGETLASEQLRFTGVTLQPGINASSKVIEITATCDLQNRVELMSQAEIEALLPGSLYAEAVYGEIEGRWDYAQDRLATLPGNLDCGPDGAMRYTPWKASAVPHFTFDAGTVLSDSLQIQPADAGQLINRVEITLEYRYSRLRHREHQVLWTHPAENFCTWLPNSTELPTQSMLLDALEQGGWALLGSPSMTTLPPSMANPCNLGGAWVNSFTADPHLLSFAATLAQRTAQTMTETYSIALEATGSMAAFGERPARERYSDEVEFDSGSWEALAAESRPDDASQDALGDWIIDQDAGARRANALQTAMQHEYVRMLASHRQTRLVFQTPITDLVYDTQHTARLQALGVTAHGKLCRVHESWDIDAGSEIATIELAISRGGAARASQSLVPPARPLFDLGAAPDPTTVLPTQIGGLVNSPPYDEELDGFAGNASAVAGGSETYPRRLSITTPDIQAEHRDPAEASAVATYLLGIPTDLFQTEVL